MDEYIKREDAIAELRKSHSIGETHRRLLQMEALIKLFLRCYVRRNPDVRAWHITIDDGCIIITVHKRQDGEAHD